MSKELAERLVPAWLAAATAAGATAVLAVAALGTHPVDPALLTYESVERTAREPSPPPPAADAPLREHVDHWSRELERARRRLQRTRESIQGLGRLEERVRSGAYPELGRERLEQRRSALDRALERDQAEVEAIERRLGELREADPGSSSG
jgi:chromosome segregation ATPase